MYFLTKFFKALARTIHTILVLVGIVFLGIITSTDYLDETLSELFSQNHVQITNNSVIEYIDDTPEDTENNGITFDSSQSHNVINTNKCEQFRDLAESVGFYGEDLEIAISVMYYESGCNVEAIGDVDYGYSYGLMQIHLPTWCTINENYTMGAMQQAGILSECDDLFDPETNLKAAYHILNNTTLAWNNWTTYRDIVSNSHQSEDFSVQTVNSITSEYVLDQITLQECADKYYNDVLEAGFIDDEILIVLQIAVLQSGCNPEIVDKYTTNIGILHISKEVWCTPNDWWPIGYLQEKLELDNCNNLSDPLISFRAAKVISTEDSRGWNNWTNYSLVDKNLTIQQTDNTIVRTDTQVTEPMVNVSSYDDEISLVSSNSSDQVLSMFDNSTNYSTVNQDELFTPMNINRVQEISSTIYDNDVSEKNNSGSVESQNQNTSYLDLLKLCMSLYQDFATNAGFINEDLQKLFEIALTNSGCNPGKTDDGFGLFGIDSVWCEPYDTWVNGYLTHVGISSNCHDLINIQVSFDAAYHLVYQTEKGWENLE